ncbi:unnamed protein product [Spodoptera littoralis]|uniref:CHK kinase-like domain-containing protein n=1 Tax=Spodoptera littoralis TaxID=7109 RepID=A0A9P0N1U0_SPOLI|nr:unnamed protein product [Spodoptera littoralis]CAH1638450.1 unnamed protein product [Spodoptera littoralis]
MVGEVTSRVLLEDILSEKQVHHIVKQATGADTWALRASDVTPAADGMAGFLADHKRVRLDVAVDGEVKHIHLFIKRIPLNNQPKADLITNNNYFRREQFMFQVLEEIRDHNDPNPWCPKAYIYTDSVIVMPDLSVEGYASPYYLDTLDYEHLMLGMAALARFHAAFTNYETKKSIANNRPYNTNDEHGNLLTEPTFCDCPFMKSCAKLTANFLKTYSCKPYRNLPDLEAKIGKQNLVACDTMREWKGTLNVLIHKDLWVNNIMFKYQDNELVNAMIVDFQLIRYTPPAFDVMTFMYLTTSRSFREQYERKLCDRYFAVFCEHLDDESKRRVKKLGYDKESFLQWCEQSRMFGLLESVAIHPFVLMHPKVAQKTFDDPETYDRLVNEDRTEPVLAYAQQCARYRDRMLEVSEEFVERYVLSEP